MQSKYFKICLKEADDVFFKAISKTPIHQDIEALGEFLLINYVSSAD